MKKQVSSSRYNKRKVLIVTPWFPNNPGDAAGSFIYDSARALKQQSTEVSVLVSRNWCPKLLSKFANHMNRGNINNAAFDEFAELNTHRGFSFPKGFARRLTAPVNDQLLKVAIEKMAKRLKPQIIHAHTEGLAPAAVAAARSLGLPVAVTIHGLTTDQKYLSSYFQKERIAGALRTADCVILVGETLHDFFKRYVGKSSHFKVVHNGTILPDFEPKLPFIVKNETRLISVGNLQEGKGVDYLLKALSRLMEKGHDAWTYQVVGDGPDRKNLEKLSVQLGIDSKVHFLGSIEHKGVLTALEAADVFVLPSYREAFGIAYLEAMAMCRLTIGVAGEGPSQFITDGKTGFLVSGRDVEALENLLTRILHGDRSQWQAIAVAGRDEVKQNWSWAAHARKLQHVFDEVLDKDDAQK